MKKMVNLFIAMFVVLLSVLFTSCNNISNETIKNSAFVFPLNTYEIYELNGNSSGEFDIMVNNNPIDEQMNKDLQDKNLDGTYEAQAFYDYYCEKWKNELNYSLNNLNTYMSNEQVSEIEKAQSEWEQSLKANYDIDLAILQENNVNLGTQVVSSRLIAITNEYRERTFHIKYMTMLVENNTENFVPKDQQLWNKFEKISDDFTIE